MKLYIFGNGFDLAHDLKTRYINYRYYIKKHLASFKWDIVLDMFPDDYEFWSDAEYYMCKFDKEKYILLKKLFGVGLLDELSRCIFESFGRFISLEVGKEVLATSPIFELDKNSPFFTFNFTTVLEDVYKIDKNRITYIHNDVSGSIMNYLFGVNGEPICILGHSQIETDFYQHNGIEKDKEYLDYVQGTTKKSDQIIIDRRLEDKIASNISEIDEVVFYGFSFSITDKKYVELINEMFADKRTSFKIYYKVPENVSYHDYLGGFKEKVKKAGLNDCDCCFINRDTIERFKRIKL